MTPLSNKILQDYQVRKTKKQKSAFIRLLQQHFPALSVQKGGFPNSRNLIIGDVESAKVLLCAHYDTCAQLPFPNFIAPKNPLLSLFYGIAIMLPMIPAVFLMRWLMHFLTNNSFILHLLSPAVCFLYLFLLFAGPANQHTANDNTSGVITLCELLQVLSPEMKTKAAFVFFDNEESGLIGSSYFRSKYKKQVKDKLVINFDCVSDGDYILLSASKAARNAYGDLLKDAFQPAENKTILFVNAEKTYYPSDQSGFRKAIAVAALKKKRFIGYYMDRIHTSRDTVFQKENIKLLCDSILRLLKKI